MFVWFLPLSLLYYVLTSFKIISFRKKDYLFPDRLLFIYVISFSIILFFYQTRLPWYLISFVPVFSIMIIVMFFRVISLISYFSGAYSKNILLILCSILLLIILFGLRLPHILDCNPEIVRIIDAIDSHPGYKFYFYDTVKSPFSIFYNVNYDKDSPSYMKEYEYIDFEDAYDHAMSHDENIYVLFVDKTLDDLNDLFYNYPELKGNAFLSLIERNIILLTNNDEFIDFGIPPQEETLYHCYRYLPYWLYSYDLEDKDIVSLQ